MLQNLRVLLISISGSDKNLVLDILKNASFKVSYRMVDTLEAFQKFLQIEAWDMIIYISPPSILLPRTVINLLITMKLDIPLIIVIENMHIETPSDLLNNYNFDFLTRDTLPLIGHKIRLLLKQIAALHECTFAQVNFKKEGKSLKTILGSIGDGVIITDSNSNIIFINKIAETLTGWSLEDAINKSVHDVFKIINKLNGKVFESPIRRALAKGSSVGLKKYSVLISKAIATGNEALVDNLLSSLKSLASSANANTVKNLTFKMQLSIRKSNFAMAKTIFLDLESEIKNLYLNK